MLAWGTSDNASLSTARRKAGPSTNSSMILGGVDSSSCGLTARGPGRTGMGVRYRQGQDEAAADSSQVPCSAAWSELRSGAPVPSWGRSLGRS